jgi:fumarylacetoacetate (FAA) hydrolase
LDLSVQLNGKSFGSPNGSEMNFSFEQLIAHAARTRPLSAGSIVGSGTVSNENKEKGFACLTEQRFQEVIETGGATTRWLAPGDHIMMQAQFKGHSVFGPIDQKVTL